MQEGGVINIERDFTDDGERFLAIPGIVDPHVLRDEPAKRIER